MSISEVIGISPSNHDSSLWFIQSSILHDVICMKVKLKVTQLSLALCDPIDYTVPGILQARILEWVAFPFSKGSSPGPWKMFY